MIGGRGRNYKLRMVRQPHDEGPAPAGCWRLGDPAGAAAGRRAASCLLRCGRLSQQHGRRRHLPRDNARLHVSTLLIAASRALNNALDQLGFPENDDRVIEHEGKLAFIVCSHDADCDDLFALITELSARGESWELQFRIDTGENRAIFQRLARHDRVEAVDSALPPEDDPETRDLPSHDLDLEAGRANLRRILKKTDPAEVFVTIGSNPAGRASATILRRNPRRRAGRGRGRRRIEPARRDPRDFAHRHVRGDDEARRRMNRPAAASRDNNFDALRLVAAVSVIFSHSFLIADGTEKHEPLIWLTGNQAILGLAGVFVFFAISGFLVTQSWEATASPPRFPRQALPADLPRPVRGAGRSRPSCWRRWSRPCPWRSISAGRSPISMSSTTWNCRSETHELPGVMFVDNPVGLEINGSLWTLRYEFMMYLMVLGLGWFRLLNIWTCLGLLALGMACVYFPQLDSLGGWGWMLSFFASGMVLYKLRGHAHLR